MQEVWDFGTESLQYKKNFENIKTDMLADLNFKLKRNWLMQCLVIDNEVKQLLVWLGIERIPAIFSVIILFDPKKIY